jgi:hypothetical protein
VVQEYTPPSPPMCLPTNQQTVTRVITGTKKIRGQCGEVFARCSDSLSVLSCCRREQGDDGRDRRYNARFIQDPFTAKHPYAASRAGSVGSARAQLVSSQRKSEFILGGLGIFKDASQCEGDKRWLDSKGDVVISFFLPSSCTFWLVRGTSS